MFFCIIFIFGEGSGIFVTIVLTSVGGGEGKTKKLNKMRDSTVSVTVELEE